MASFHSSREGHESEPTLWWAGIATVLPRGSLVPLTGGRWLRRWNELRLDSGRVPLFRAPDLTPDEARQLAAPTSTGLGDLLCAWMMPMALAQHEGWQLCIPVPDNAGGLHHDASRARLTAEWFAETFDFPNHVRLVTAEAAPEDADWFCTLTQQWHLDSCMETSYDTIPSCLRSDVDRDDYYVAYRDVARNLMRPPASSGYCVLYARRGDRGVPADESSLRNVLSVAAERSRTWAVVSDNPETAASLRGLLAAMGCSVAPGDDGAVGNDALIRDFTTLAGAQLVVSSVRGGWSAFPYAATRISGAPLVVTERLEDSLIWRVIRAHSVVPVTGIHHGPQGLAAFLDGHAGARG